MAWVGSALSSSRLEKNRPIATGMDISRVMMIKPSPNKITRNQPCFILGFFVVRSVMVIRLYVIYKHVRELHIYGGGKIYPIRPDRHAKQSTIEDPSLHGEAERSGAGAGA